MKDAFKQYAEEVNEDLKFLTFIYKGKNYFYGKIKNKKVKDIAINDDIRDEKMHITVTKKLKIKNYYDDSVCATFSRDDCIYREFIHYNSEDKRVFYTYNFIVLIIHFF